MALTREELLLLMIYTSPIRRDGNPTVIGSTKIQKLIFLATQESDLLKKLCPDPYDFIPYDFGPYSPRLDQDLRQLERMGWVSSGESDRVAKSVKDMTFEELTKHIKKAPTGADLYILRGPAVQQIVARLETLRGDGFDVALILDAFKKHHAKFDSMTSDNLLKYVYAQYPATSVNTKRKDLLPDRASHSIEEEDADDDP